METGMREVARRRAKSRKQYRIAERRARGPVTATGQSVYGAPERMRKAFCG